MGLVISGIIHPWQIVLVVVLVLLLVGGKKIPELLRGLKNGLCDFKKGIKGESEKPQEK